MARLKRRKDIIEPERQNNLYFYIIIFILLIQTTFLFYKNREKLGNLFAENVNVNLPDDTERIDKTSDKPSETAGDQLNRTVRLNILNGCDVPGLASNWKEKLRKMNYDVRETGNSEKKYLNSIILSRIEDMQPARQLAKQLGINNMNVLQQINKDLVDIDITLIVGADHDELNGGR